MGLEQVRVRMAPSPTGDPHVGTAYVTLFNYAFAKKHQGQLVLRIEDTDQARYRASSETMIMESLKWLGFSWDEGPDVGGPYGPYRQSERREIHQKWAYHLVDHEHAYRCFCTSERLEEMRQVQRTEGQKTGYDRHCRGLTQSEVQGLLAQKLPFVIRLKMPTSGVTTVQDLLRGEVSIDNSQLDDQVLLKSDGYPTYHLANVVDDHLMRISHVIRAEEWISSTPKHVLLYRAFGWKEPVFCHLPLLRNSDKSKISKRKNPTSLLYYQRAGILPEAMANFLGLMGWSFGGDREVFSIDEMIPKFDLKDIHLGGPIFDHDKLHWLNHQYLQKMSEQKFVDYFHQEMFSSEYLKKLRPLVIERLERFDQFVDKFAFFFSGGLNYEGVSLIPQGRTATDTGTMLSGLVEVLDEAHSWDESHIKEILDHYKTSIAWKPKDFFMTIRLAVTGRKDSPPLVESMVVIGREMVRYRVRAALKAISTAS